MASEATEPRGSSPAAGEPEPEPAAGNLPGTHDPTPGSETTAADAAVGLQGKHPPSSSPDTSAEMPPRIFVLAVIYLASLITLFVIYVSWHRSGHMFRRVSDSFPWELSGLVLRVP